MKKPRLRANTYEVVSRAVEEGIAYGWNRARKHTDEPSPEQEKEAIYEAVMLALSEVIQF